MSRLPYKVIMLLSAGLSLAGAVLGDNTVQAQEPVKITTVDGIRINAVFYPSAKKGAPTVIMLHPIGEGKSIKLPGWKTLAESLQKNDYSVLMFDFRGHGESTAIDDMKDFLSYPINRFPLKEKETIDYKDYKAKAASYLPVLTNDIAAVRSFLERRNDMGACNTSSIIVIGADNGATLGAIWINSEWYRHKLMFDMFKGLQPEKRPEGKDIIAAIFLTPQSKLGTRSVVLGNVLKIPCKDNAMATLLVCGKEDAEGKNFAKKLESALKPKTASKKHDFIGTVELDTNLTGVKLLQEGLKTDELIATYLEKVVKDRGNEWTDRDSKGSLSIWRLSTGKMVPARRKGEANILFDDYNKFAQ